MSFYELLGRFKLFRLHYMDLQVKIYLKENIFS